MTGFVIKKIGRRRSLGSLLKAARTKLGLTIEEAEVQTKVRWRYLQALETGDYQQLPAEAYNIGFVRCYAEFLKLNPEKIVDLYRQERSEKRFDEQANHFTHGKIGDWSFLVTPKIIGGVGALLLFGGIIFYIGSQLRQFNSPPRLSLTNAPAEFTSTKDHVQLRGETTVGATVLMNAEPIAVSTDGQFSQDIQLAPGVNEVIIAARSRTGKEARQTVKVLFNPNLARAN